LWTIDRFTKDAFEWDIKSHSGLGIDDFFGVVGVFKEIFWRSKMDI
jgi:hypothetical protein